MYVRDGKFPMSLMCALPLAGACVFGLASAVRAAVPLPAETPAQVIVNGRTVTARDIRIVNVKQELPDTFSAPEVKSIPGYDWYVSQHFALRSQVDERQSRDYLTIAELAYPQYVWIFGKAPDGSGRKRIALSFSKSMEDLRKASIADLGGVGWLGGGGGVTLNNNHVSYNYPGGGLQAHKRGLVMHENLHAFQMDLNGNNTPVWFTEGITYGLEQHVYDPVKTQLTVMVLDRAVGNNHTDTGLAYMRTNFVEAQEFWLGKEGMGYKPDVYQLWMQFLWSDLDRQMRERVWLHERLARNSNVPEAGFDQAIMEQLFNVPALNQAWHEWVNARRNSFHYVDWGFEQESDTFWSYGWPGWARYAQQNMNLLLKDAPTDDPYVMDWPVYAAKPATVGDVRRGVAEPSIGCVIDFSRAFKYSGGNGRAGLGFGVAGTGQRPDDRKKSNIDQEHLDIVIADIGSRTNACLILDGSTVGLPRTTEKFAPAFLDAAVTGKQSVGMTVMIRKAAVEVTLRTGSAEAMQTHRSLIPVTPEIRERLLSKPWCILSKDAYHGFTLFPDVMRVETRNYAKSEPAGRNRFLPTDETFRLYHAAWRLGNQAPASLLALQKRMLVCAGKPLAEQQQALADYRSDIGAVARDVAACRDKARAQQALADLLGIELRFSAKTGETPGQVVLTAHAVSRTPKAATGRLTLVLRPANEGQPAPQSIPIAVEDGQPGDASWTLAFPPAWRTGTRATATLTVAWNGQTTSLEQNLTLFPSISRWWTLAPFDNKGDGTVDTVLPPETEPIDLAKTYVGQNGQRIRWQKKDRPADLPMNSELVLNFGDVNNAAAYAVTWIESPVARDAFLGVGSDDGVVVWINDERVHRNLVNRGYEPKGDRIPVHLKAGRNKLLMKVTQTSGPWQASAYVLDKDGNEITELRYVDAP
jgi:hypothetical protein